MDMCMHTVIFCDCNAGKESQKAVEVVCANEDCMAEIPEHLSFKEVNQ